MKNKLVQYKGGSYDGCIWEWNYGVFDEDSEFHIIFASGSRGCETAEEMLEFIDAGIPGDHNSRLYLYDITSEKDLDKFAQTSNEGHVHGVAKYLCENFGIDVVAQCSKCGENFPAQDMRPAGLEGAGGIAMQYSLLLCEDCNMEALDG